VPEASGKVVLVTGASSGIGKACAQHLAACGFRVFGTQRKIPAETDGRGVEMIGMNVDDEHSVERGVQTILGKAGRIDAVINNAGNAIMGAVEDTSIEEAKAQLAKFTVAQEKDEAGASTPEPVAQLVERILRDPSPPALQRRYARATHRHSP